MLARIHVKLQSLPYQFAAAGLVSSSNPEGSNWKLFEAAAAPGSWLMLLKRAGHTTFMKPPTGVEAWLLDRVFGGGPLPRDTAVSQTAAAMLGWFGQELAQQHSGKQQHSKAAAVAAVEGSSSPLQSVTAGLGVPLASAGLQAAAAAAAGLPAAVSGGSSGIDQAADEAAAGGPRLAAVFQDWVAAAGSQADVEFWVKS